VVGLENEAKVKEKYKFFSKVHGLFCCLSLEFGSIEELRDINNLDK